MIGAVASRPIPAAFGLNGYVFIASGVPLTYVVSYANEWGRSGGASSSGQVVSQRKEPGGLHKLRAANLMRPEDEDVLTPGLNRAVMLVDTA